MSTGVYIRELLEKYRNGTCTPEEAARLEYWFDQFNKEENRLQLMSAADEEGLVQRMKADPTMVKTEPAPVRISFWHRVRRRIFSLFSKRFF